MARQRHPRPRHLVVLGAASGMGRWLWDNVFSSAEWDSVSLIDTPEAAPGLLEASTTSTPHTTSTGYAGRLTCAVTAPGSPTPVDLKTGAPLDLSAELTTVCFAVPPAALASLAAAITPALAPTASLFVTAQSMVPALEALTAAAGERPAYGLHPLFDVTSRQLEGQAVYVVPAGDPHGNAHRWLVELLRERGAAVKFGTAAKHDRSMGYVQGMAHQALLGFASAVVDSGLDLQDDIWAARTPLFETLFGLAVRVLDERTQANSAAIQTALNGAQMSAELRAAAAALESAVVSAAPTAVEARIAAVRDRFSGALFDTVRGTAAAAVVAAQSKRLQLARHQRSTSLVGIRPLGRADTIRVGHIVDVDPVEVTIDEVLVGRRGRAALLDGPGSQNAVRLGLGGKVRRTVFSLGHVDLVVGDDLDRELDDWLAYLRRDVRFLVPESVAGSGVAEVVAPVPGIRKSELISEVVRTGQRAVVVRVEVRVDRDIDDMVERLRQRVADAFRWPRGLSLPLVSPTDRVTYLGPAGTFSEVAAGHLAADLGMPSARLLPVESFGHVLESVASGGVAVIPVSSSSSGLVTRSVEALLAHDGEIAAGGVIDVAVRIDAYIREDHRLDELHGAPVFSHPQALAQCAAFIRRWSLQPHACSSTAEALRRVAEADSPAVGLAGEGRGAGLGIKVAEREVDDLSGSITRFLIVGQPGSFADLVGGSAPTLRSIYVARSIAAVARQLSAGATGAVAQTQSVAHARAGGEAVSAEGSAAGSGADGIPPVGGGPAFDEILADAEGRALWITSRAPESVSPDPELRPLGRAPWSPRTPVVRVEA
ncbi:MAG: prephenate dehydratase domain-containing protein [Dermatophilaceae bacterium]|nr:hypothetical protein [Actinomycetales bacterium]